TLMASGVPIEGERGVGYILREPIFLPPMTLTPSEMEALHLGMEIVRRTAGRDISEAASRILVKVDAVLPRDRQGREHLGDLSVFVLGSDRELPHLALLKAAISARQTIEIDYLSLSNQVTRRCIRPLQCEYWGSVWTCTAWCELRNDFRTFRIDRIEHSRASGSVFQVEPGKSYDDYLASIASSTDTG
ncbi:MAG TPA: WYL domain-containing protein, partial [Devosia sp.]|nr:WYL domain-containing protein [Devosia sp.]